VQRQLVLAVTLILALGTSLNLVGAAQDAATCPIFGHYRGFFLQSPDADTVVVRYDFEIPAGMYLPLDDYPDTLSVYVEQGTFDLTVDAATERSAVVVVRDGGPKDARQTEVEPGKSEQGLDARDLVFHQESTYEYRNVSDDTGILLVSVVISRDTFEQALQEGKGGDPRHEGVCKWCEALKAQASLQKTASDLPALQCRGG
jgi:hypothetical protein